MKSRPWPLVLLALGSFLSPVTNTILNAWIENKSVLDYLRYFFTNRSGSAIFEYYILDPISGIAIWTMKLWVYPFFLTLQSLTLFKNIFIWWTEYQGRASGLVLAAVCLVNILVVTYYLLPQVRVFFFNRRMRWWEAAPRFHLGLPATLRREGQSPCPVRIVDISVGGFFSEAGPADLQVGNYVEVHFELMDVVYLVRGKIVHTGRGGAGNFGVQFDKFEEALEDQLHSLIAALKVLGRATNRNTDMSLKNFKAWIVRLVKTGKGLVPEVQVQKKPRPVKNQPDKVA